jgi:hypothetical protein
LEDRENAVFITRIDEDGIFHASEIGEGDKVLSINGNRLKKGEGAKHVLKTINKAKLTVTMVVKKSADATQHRQQERLDESPRVQQSELGAYDAVTPRKNGIPSTPRNSSNSYGKMPKTPKTPRTPSQKEKELDADVLITPRIPFTNSALALQPLGEDSGPLSSSSEGEGDSDPELEKSVAKVLSKTSNEEKNHSLTATNNASWSHPNSVGSKSRKGKRPSAGASLPSLGVPLPVKKSPQSAKPAPKRAVKTSKPADDDASDESSLEAEMEEALATLKKETDLHNSWSHPNHMKSVVDSKKGKRSSSASSRSKRKSLPDKPKKVPKSKAEPRPVSDDNSSPEQNFEDGNAQLLAYIHKTVLSAKPKPVTKKSKAKPKAKMTKTAGDISDESSIEEGQPHQERKIKEMNQMSVKSSLLMTSPDEYEGDFMQIKVRKNSEEDTGIKLKKIKGALTISKLPDHEKRINTGARILGVNGTMNIATVAKADDLMKQTKGYVTLTVDFSSPIENERNCPCCRKPIFANGEHCENQNEAGLFTPKAGNRSNHGKQKVVTSKFNIDDYVSDSE